MKFKFEALISFCLFLVCSLLSLNFGSIAFSSFCEDKDTVALAEIEKQSDTYDAYSIKFSSFDSFSSDSWNEYTKTFDSRFTSMGYSNIFRVIKNVPLTLENSSFDVAVADIVHYADPFYNFGNITLISSDGQDFSKLEEGLSIYIDTYIADALKELYSLNIAGYECLFGRTVSLSLESNSPFVIRGVYSENSKLYKKNYNNLYFDCFGHTVFVSRNVLNVESGGEAYAFIGSDHEKNQTIFDYIEGRWGGNVSFVNCANNNKVIIRGNTLSSFYASKIVPPSCPVFVIILLLILFLIFAFLSFFSQKKLLSKIFDLFSNNKNCKFYSLLLVDGVFAFLSSLFFIISSKTSLFVKLPFGVFKNSLSFWFFMIYIIIIVANSILFLFRFYNQQYLKKVYSPFNDNFLKSCPAYTNFDFVEKNKHTKMEFNNCAAVVFSRGIDKQSAAGQRAITDGQLLSFLGYDVYLSGFSNSVSAIDDLGVKCFSWDKYEGHNIFKRYLNYMTSKHIKKFFLSVQHINLIVVYSVLSVPQIKAIRSYAKKYNVPIVFDVVEFQNFFEQNPRSFFTYYLPNMYINLFAITKKDYVIAISKYLRVYFEKKGVKTYLIPFINRNIYSLIKNISFYTGSKTIFLYAGTPGKKDNLFGMIKAFSLLNDEEKRNSLFLIAGPTARNLDELGIPKNVICDCGDSLVFLGKVPYEKMKCLYSLSDFTILLKNNKARHAKADFPSKVSQSLAYGVPVIANSSSDLSNFLKDGYNSILFEGNDYIKLSQSMKRALNTEAKELEIMKNNSLDTAKTKLGFDLGITVMMGLLMDIKEN